jgi:hypothetical protein
VLNSLIKSKCLVCQTGLSGFSSSNSAVSFVEFQNHLFTPPPSRRHQGTFRLVSPGLVAQRETGERLHGALRDGGPAVAGVPEARASRSQLS